MQCSEYSSLHSNVAMLCIFLIYMKRSIINPLFIFLWFTICWFFSSNPLNSIIILFSWGIFHRFMGEFILIFFEGGSKLSFFLLKTSIRNKSSYVDKRQSSDSVNNHGVVLLCKKNTKINFHFHFVFMMVLLLASSSL